jgi:hypothetical protein
MEIKEEERVEVMDEKIKEGSHTVLLSRVEISISFQLLNISA